MMNLVAPFFYIVFLTILPLNIFCKENKTNVFRGTTVNGPLAAESYLPPSNKCRIFLIRHGETEWNVLGLSQGWEDVPLNENGREQAAHLALNFSALSISAIYTSVLSRAVETAINIADYHPSCKIYFDPTLRFYDPQKKLTITETNKDEIEDEIKAEIIERATAYLKELSATHLGQNVIILTHGKVIKHLVEDQNIPGYTKVKISNAAMVPMLGTIDTLTME